MPLPVIWIYCTDLSPLHCLLLHRCSPHSTYLGLFFLSLNGFILHAEWMWQCTHSPGGTTVAAPAWAVEGLCIPCNLKQQWNTTYRALLRWDHNPPSCCYQNGLNRTIEAEEFRDGSIMHTKQVDNKSDEELFHSAPLCINTTGTDRKRDFCCSVFDYYPSPQQGRCCYQSTYISAIFPSST